MRDRRGGDAHVRADHHGTGARVDDDARRGVSRLDLDRLERSQIGNPRVGVHRRNDAYRDAIERFGGARANGAVDCLGDTRRGGEVRSVEIQHQVRVGGEVYRHLALDRGTTGYAAAAWYVERHARAVLAGDPETAHHDAT